MRAPVDILSSCKLHLRNQVRITKKKHLIGTLILIFHQIIRTHKRTITDVPTITKLKAGNKKEEKRKFKSTKAKIDNDKRSGGTHLFCIYVGMLQHKRWILYYDITMHISSFRQTIQLLRFMHISVIYMSVICKSVLTILILQQQGCDLKVLLCLAP